MEKNTLDSLFREKIDRLDDIPEDSCWNSDHGWKDYERKYLSSGMNRRKILFYLSSAAAVLLVMITTILSIKNRSQQTITVTNENSWAKEFILADGNRLWLNKESIAEYPARVGKHYEFTISGEAWFEINSPVNSEYVINAQSARILVDKPCRFNIKARQDEENVNITVETGIVKVTENNREEGMTVLVPAGNYCSVHKSQNIAYTSLNRNNNYLAWKTGKLSFKSEPMSTVSDILSEYYNTIVELEDKTLAYCRFSGNFERQPIETILNQIQSELNLVIRNTGTSITISGKGCLTF